MLRSFAAALALVAALPVASHAQSVFVNEIHYDNTGTDAGELVEIAGTAGTDLSSYSLVLYNGAGGAVYNTLALSGTIPDQQNGFGTLSFGYPSNGIQNGSPDGVALVRNGTEVIQFLSYEGTFTAVGGPANGMASVDIGVIEAGADPVGFSLQLTGSGDEYPDFTWSAPSANTSGAVNTGQSFGGPPPTPSLSINDVSIAEGNSGTSSANFTVSLSSAAGPGGVTFEIATADGSATAGSDYDAVATTGTIPEGSLNLTFSVSVHGDVDLEPDETFSVSITNVGGADVADASGTGTILNDDATPPPATSVVINELDSDTPGTDAAEFVELYDGGSGNTSLSGLVVVFYNGSNDLSYAAFDLDGRTTDANGYFVLGNAAVPGVGLVFGGNLLQNGADAVALYAGNAADYPNGTPVTLANLIDAVVYDTSDADDAGLLALLNAGQPQVNEDGGASGAAVDSIQRCPNGEGGERHTEGFLALGPTPNAANGPCPIPPPPPAPHTIAEIQGQTDSSPYLGTDVITSGVVTGRKLNGFFLQSLAPDADPLTSEGVFVFTSTPPQVSDSGTPRPVALGDVLEVTGRVVEFRRSSDSRPETLTEISSLLEVSLLNEGQPLPAALDASLLFAPGASSRVVQLERYESMLVTAGDVRAVGPTNAFGEFYAVLAGTPRPFREPGILSGDPLPADAPTPNAIPVFDGNFERIMVETDEQTDDAGLRRAPLNVSSGATVSGAFGPLDYAFDEYRVQVDASAALAATGGLDAAVPVPATAPGQFAIGAANLLNFINPAPERFVKASLMIRNVLRTPAILGAIEVGGGTELQQLADAVNADAGTSYQAFLLDADESSASEQNVGFLVDTARVDIVEGPTQLFKGKTFTFAGVTDRLHDRPPLLLKVDVRRPGSSQTFPVTLLLLHLRSLIDVDSSAPFGGGETVGARVREKRRLGAEDVADAIEERQADNLVVLGDLNAFQFNDGFGDIVGTLRGAPAPADQVVEASVDRWDHELHDLVDGLADLQQRYSYVFGGSAQVLDHVLVNAPMLAQLAGLHYARNNADFPASLQTDFSRSEAFSDHDPVVAYFSIPAAPTTTSLASSLNPSLEGQPVTFTASVTALGSSPSGDVEFSDGSTVLATIPLDGSGQAAFTTSSLAVGSHVLTARFAGTPALLPSSGSLTQSVLPDTRPRILAFAPPSGFILTPVLIRGSNFNQVTAVRFNGKPTLFLRLSSEFILTIVPIGATSGPVSVTAGGGTAVSETAFTVRRLFH